MQQDEEEIEVEVASTEKQKKRVRRMPRTNAVDEDLYDDEDTEAEETQEVIQARWVTFAIGLYMRRLIGR